MYTRTPNYMWMLKRLYDSPYSYHWNEWGLKSGVRVLNAHRKRRISTNTIKLNIKREREKESGEQKNRNLVKQKIHRCTKFDEMWRALTYRMIFTLLHQTILQRFQWTATTTIRKKNVRAQTRTTNIYFSYFSGWNRAFGECKSELWFELSAYSVQFTIVCCICVHDVSVWYLLCDFFASACALIRIIAHIWYGNGQINRTHISSSACQICCRLNYESKSESQSAKGANKIRRFLYTASTSVGSFELHKIFAQFLCWKCHGSSS